MAEITTFGASASGTRISRFSVGELHVSVTPMFAEGNDRARELAERLAAFVETLTPSDVGQIEPEPTIEACVSIDPVYTVSHQTAATTEEPTMNTAPTNTLSALTVGTRVMLTKGCKAIGLDKGVTARVQSVTELGADYSHSVRVTLFLVNGFKSGKTVALYARHVNRLADPIVRMNDGNPTHTIEVRRA